MTRAAWTAAERAFNRREPLKEIGMGQGRWSMRSVGGAESHTIEFGFRFRFDVRAGPKSNGLSPDCWYASSRDGSLGEHPTLEVALRACEEEARRLIEKPDENGVADIDATFVREQWTAYLASKNCLRSVKTHTRYK